MSVDFSPSVNIVRDFDRQLEYIPTANSRRIYNQIVNDYALGIHAFSVIGSYGTGKSAFLLAFERTLTRQHSFFPSPNGHFNGVDSFRFINVVGAFDSLDKTIRTKLDISVDEDLFSGLDRLTDSGAVNNTCVVLVVDEFGKYEETLRLYPPLANIVRTLLADDTLSGYTVPAGSNVVINTYTVHRHPDFWENPEGFDSTRFLPEQSKVRNRFAYIPFEPRSPLLYRRILCQDGSSLRTGHGGAAF